MSMKKTNPAWETIGAAVEHYKARGYKAIESADTSGVALCQRDHEGLPTLGVTVWRDAHGDIVAEEY